MKVRPSPRLQDPPRSDEPRNSRHPSPVEHAATPMRRLSPWRWAFWDVAQQHLLHNSSGICRTGRLTDAPPPPLMRHRRSLPSAYRSASRRRRRAGTSVAPVPSEPEPSFGTVSPRGRSHVIRQRCFLSSNLTWLVTVGGRGFQRRRISGGERCHGGRTGPARRGRQKGGMRDGSSVAPGVSIG